MNMEVKGVLHEDVYPVGLTMYRVQATTRFRRGVPVKRPKRFWMRTWQAEWDGAPRAFRAYTRNGSMVRAVRAWKRLAHRRGTDA